MTAETKHFVNDGYGWTCKRCRATSAPPASHDDSGAGTTSPAHQLPRFFREGEAEERDAALSSPSLARWKDEARRTLVCPRCHVEETLTADASSE